MQDVCQLKGVGNRESEFGRRAAAFYSYMVIKMGGTSFAGYTTIASRNYYL